MAWFCRKRVIAATWWERRSLAWKQWVMYVITCTSNWGPQGFGPCVGYYRVCGMMHDVGRLMLTDWHGTVQVSRGSYADWSSQNPSCLLMHKLTVYQCLNVTFTTFFFFLSFLYPVSTSEFRNVRVQILAWKRQASAAELLAGEARSREGCRHRGYRKWILMPSPTASRPVLLHIQQISRTGIHPRECTIFEPRYYS